MSTVSYKALSISLVALSKNLLNSPEFNMCSFCSSLSSITGTVKVEKCFKFFTEGINEGTLLKSSGQCSNFYLPSSLLSSCLSSASGCDSDSLAFGIAAASNSSTSKIQQYTIEVFPNLDSLLQVLYVTILGFHVTSPKF